MEPSEYFIGLKTFAVDPKIGIKESFTKNYFPLLLEKNETLKAAQKEKRYWRDLWYKSDAYLLEQMRVGYAGDALYSFNPLFADFIFPNKSSKTLWFK